MILDLSRCHFSNIISKAMQYIGDSGYAKTHGAIGYILEMEAVLGKHITNYRVAGTSGRDNIRSPEWAVFSPNRQLRIVKAYKVKLVSNALIKNFKKKHPKAVSEDRYFGHLKKFKELFMEQKITGNNAINYTFQEGEVPINKKKTIDFDKFAEKVEGNDNIEVYPGQKGPIVTVRTKRPVENIMIDVPRVGEFMHYDPEGYFTQFLALIKAAGFKG